MKDKGEIEGDRRGKESIISWLSRSGYKDRKEVGDGAWIVAWNEGKLITESVYYYKGRTNHAARVEGLMSNSGAGFGFNAYDGGQEGVAVFLSSWSNDFFNLDNESLGRFERFEQALAFFLSSLEDKFPGRKISWEITDPGSVIFKDKNEIFPSNDFEPMLRIGLIAKVLTGFGYARKMGPAQNSSTYVRENTS